MIVAVVGVGLIGGSLCLDLRQRGFAHYLIGVDSNSEHAEIALQRGLVDCCRPLSKAVRQADMVVLAVPVNHIITLLPEVLDLIDAETIVTDMGSTKQRIVQTIATHKLRRRFVAAHPMAGTEHSGPQAAMSGLFDHKVAILCDDANSDQDALYTVTRLFETLQMQVICMNSDEHDIHAAYVSHISHITSFVLANTVLEKEKSASAIFDMAGGGFASTVRLAKSSPKMWSQIFEQNANNILPVLDTYIENLSRWRNDIENANFAELEESMKQANDIRRILN